MKAQTDELRIGHGFREEDGTKLEPEAQPVDRVITTAIPVTLGNAPGQGTSVAMPMRGQVTEETTALDAANAFSAQCHLCTHWDPAAYKRERLAGKYTVEELNDQRLHVLELAAGSELTALQAQQADAILDATLGRCHAYAHLDPEGRLDTHARAGCPSAGPDGAPLERAFSPRLDSRKDVTSIRDRILVAAAKRS